MQFRFEPPPYRDSVLANLDPRWRLLSLLLVLLTVIVVQTLFASLLCLLLGVYLTWLARTPWSWLRGRLVMISILLGCFAGPLALLAPEGSFLALRLVVKGLAMFGLVGVSLVTAPFHVTLQAAHRLWIPGLLIQLTLLSYRYLFVLSEELTRLRVALRTRAFRNRANLHSYRTVAAASGTLLVRGVERAERVAAAMRSRGFDGRYRSLTNFSTRWPDVAAFGLSLLFCILTITLDILLRS